jgi:hypothetical protein
MSVKGASECYFYHVMDIPGHGLVGEEWDLRGKEAEYLGGVDFAGKRVLELGTASGHLCRYMESQGADVVGFDLSDDCSWDIVPFARWDSEAVKAEFKAFIPKLKKGWWFCRKAFGSKARVVYGDIYNIPSQLGPVDVTTFGSILLHLQNPFAAMHSALRLTRETAIVTEVSPEAYPQWPSLGGPSGHVPARRWAGLLTGKKAGAEAKKAGAEAPLLMFLPNFREITSYSGATWWVLSPKAVIEFLGVLGFEETRVTHHKQTRCGTQIPMYTVVGRRTQGKPSV